MRWGCRWGERWGAVACSQCVPFVPEHREPGLILAIPPWMTAGAMYDVNGWTTAVSQVPVLWFAGTTVTGKPTVGNC